MFKYSSVPAWTLGSKSRVLGESKVPGPGNYDSTDMAANKDRAPSWSVPKQEKGQKYGNPNPGPGQYDNSSNQKILKGYMGAKSATLQGLNVPGPGAYEDEHNTFAYDKAPAFTIRGKNIKDKNKNVPGPGRYDPDSIAWKSYSGKLTTLSKRDGQGDTKFPGPGNYEPANQTFRKKYGKFARGGRKELADQNVPGPGSYDMGLNRTGGYSQGKVERNKAFLKTVPGPGAYDYNSSSFGGPKWKQGTQARNYLRKSDTPAPGNYESLGQAFTKTSGKIMPEGKAATTYSYPGPGAYDADFTLQKNKHPKFSFPKQLKADRERKVPGPGAYDPAEFKSRAGVPLGKGEKGMKYGNKFPGPGAYDQNAENRFNADAKYSFGKQARGKDQKESIGYHDVPHSIPDVAKYNYPALNHRKIQVYPDFNQL